MKCLFGNIHLHLSQGRRASDERLVVTDYPTPS